METLLKNFSKKMLHLLNMDTHATELEYLQAYYGMQTLLYNIIVTFSILLSSYILSCFKETFFLFLIFGILRVVAGGFHFKSMEKCICATTLIMLGGGKYIATVNSPYFLCMALCIFSNLVFFLHVPKGSKKNPYSQDYTYLQKKRLHIVSLFLTITAICKKNVSPIIALSMFLTALFLLPDLLHRFQEAE